MLNAQFEMNLDGTPIACAGSLTSAFDTLSTGPVTLWVTGWKKSLIERSAQAVPMVALMWAGNPIKTLLPVQISATIFSAVRFREDSGSMLAA